MRRRLTPTAVSGRFGVGGAASLTSTSIIRHDAVMNLRGDDQVAPQEQAQKMPSLHSPLGGVVSIVRPQQGVLFSIGLVVLMLCLGVGTGRRLRQALRPSSPTRFNP